MNKAITLITALLALSIINEKLVFMIRKYLPHLWWFFPASWKEKTQDKIAVNNLTEEQRQEREVGLLSALTGSLIAAFAGANLKELVDSGASALKFSFDHFQCDDIPQFILIGFLLSLGSKFFHDLLDLLLQTKNVQRQLAKDESMMDLTSKEYAQLAFNTYENNLLQKPNVSSVSEPTLMPGFNNVYGLIVTLKDGDESTVSKELEVSYNSIAHAVPLSIVLNGGDVVVHSGRIPIPGEPISSGNSSGEQGTLGCFLHDISNALFFITCYHVVNSGLPDIFRSKNYPEQINISDIYANKIGTLDYGILNDYMDLALIKADRSISRATNNSIIKHRPIAEKDRQEPFTFAGAGTNDDKIECKIVGIGVSVADIIYGEQEKRTLRDLIELQNSDGYAPSRKGDSGGIVVDSNGCAVAMIIAAGKNKSYAIRMERIMNQLGDYTF